jgi:hypothetical protein
VKTLAGTLLCVPALLTSGGASLAQPLPRTAIVVAPIATTDMAELSHAVQGSRSPCSRRGRTTAARSRTPR